MRKEINKEKGVYIIKKVSINLTNGGTIMKKFCKCRFFGFRKTEANTSTRSYRTKDRISYKEPSHPYPLTLKYSVPSAKFFARFPITESRILRYVRKQNLGFQKTRLKLCLYTQQSLLLPLGLLLSSVPQMIQCLPSREQTLWNKEDGKSVVSLFQTD